MPASPFINRPEWQATGEPVPDVVNGTAAIGDLVPDLSLDHKTEILKQYGLKSSSQNNKARWPADLKKALLLLLARQK
jgi:hypothetical protein